MPIGVDSFETHLDMIGWNLFNTLNAGQVINKHVVIGKPLEHLFCALTENYSTAQALQSIIQKKTGGLPKGISIAVTDLLFSTYRKRFDMIFNMTSIPDFHP